MATRHTRPASPEARAFLSLLAGALVLAACTAVRTSSAAPTAPGETVAGASTSASSPASEPSPGQSDGNLPGASRDPQTAAVGIEQLLPDEIGGTPVTKGSMAGDRFLTSGMSTPDLAGVLVRLGLRPDQIRVAFAYTAMGPSGTGVFAFRVSGAGEQELRRALAGGRSPETGGSNSGPKAVGGKPTVTIADETLPGGRSVYRYAAGSLVFFITAGHESVAGEILAGLP